VFDWLFDNRLIIGVLLCAVLAAFGAAWWRTRKKQYAISAGVVLLLLAVYGLLAWFLIETSSQLMKRRVIDMAESVERKDIKATLEKSLTGIFALANTTRKASSKKPSSFATASA
jgi:hypothetical protein